MATASGAAHDTSPNGSQKEGKRVTFNASDTKLPSSSSSSSLKSFAKTISSSIGSNKFKTVHPRGKGRLARPRSSIDLRVLDKQHHGISMVSQFLHHDDATVISSLQTENGTKLVNKHVIKIRHIPRTESMPIVQDKEKVSTTHSSTGDKKSIHVSIDDKKSVRLSIDDNDLTTATMGDKKSKLARSISNDGKPSVRRKEGVASRQIRKLVDYLHSEVPMMAKQKLDHEEMELLNTLDHGVDLDRYFDPTRQRTKSWLNFPAFDQRKRSIFQIGGDDDSSSADGIPMVNFDVKGAEWNDIHRQAGQALEKFESSAVSVRSARRGSLMQPRILFLSPHPETGWEKIWQTGHCLPMRRWTSELFMASKETTELLTDDVRRALKWNASCDDFRHLLSPELSHFSSDINSLIVEASRKLSRCNRIQRYVEAPLNQVRFRRMSFGGKLWSAKSHMKVKSDNYEGRLCLMRQNSSGCRRGSFESIDSAVSSGTNGTNEPPTMQRLRSRFASIAVVNNDPDITDVIRIGSDPIAKQLTKIERDLFMNINSTELSRFLLRPQSVDQENCPDLTALFGFQKRIIQLIATTILSDDSLEIRANKIAFFVEIAEMLVHQRNYHSFHSVITSLQSPPIARMKTTWKYMSDNFSDHYCEFITLSEVISKEDVDVLNYIPPFIPFFEEMIEDIKTRCALKLNELKGHRFHGRWTEPLTIANWIYDEVGTLEKMMQSNSCEESRKAKKKSKDKTATKVLRRIKSSMKKNFHHSHDGTKDTKSLVKNGDHKTEIEHATKAASNSSDHTKSDDWCHFDVCKLKSDDENEILKVISTTLKEYHNKMRFYQLTDDEAANKYLLFQSYESMDTSMRRSHCLEPKESKKIRSTKL